ncbi:hypothetical protein ACOMHN_020754 [Nucella lapillus]
MATKLKGLQLLPLWRRRVPRYPLYWHGDPQLQVVMPHFWMKLVRPKRDIPDDQVRFIIHPQMSVFDVKNYLEKIYSVPVLNVRTKIMAGEDIKHPTRGHVITKEDDVKIAFVQLNDGVTFEFPDLFAENKPPTERQAKEIKRQDRIGQEEERKFWDKLTVPSWFR